MFNLKVNRMKRKNDFIKHWRAGILAVLMCFGITAAYAQSVTVKGKVVDENGEPIIGANVIEKGSTNGIVTDLGGNYSLSLPGTGTIQFSYIGYNTKEE